MTVCVCVCEFGLGLRQVVQGDYRIKIYLEKDSVQLMSSRLRTSELMYLEYYLSTSKQVSGSRMFQ